ncbi:hypothetical protein [Nitrosopumilus sp.]|uniref:hypothetical protein n=1 Tax=Nitrosopumilus sp. TaxID=2024843 RepID=UPI00247D2230|nr:hypothetical protein [Nitrosopumilus sp.]MCV0430218.1 hypothetical protein [Nitrosopumilus sp.]
MVLNEKILDEILIHLDDSMNILAKDAFENLEFTKSTQVEEFLQSQFDTRLENLLTAKKSSIHHLESGMKNKIIQRKQSILDRITSQFNN